MRSCDYAQDDRFLHRHSAHSEVSSLRHSARSEAQSQNLIRNVRIAGSVSTLFLLLVLLTGNAALGASPRTNYLLYCSGCHLPSGIGNPPNVPTLHDELGRMLVVEEMRPYLVQVPGSSQTPLTDADLAAVVNWMLYEFNAGTLPKDFEPLTVEEVTEARKTILADPLKYRIQYWKDYDFD